MELEFADNFSACDRSKSTPDPEVRSWIDTVIATVDVLADKPHRAITQQQLNTAGMHAGRTENSRLVAGIITVTDPARWTIRWKDCCDARLCHVSEGPQ